MIKIAFCRVLMKELQRVRTFPYHLQDVRFILSYPLVPAPPGAAGMTSSHQVSPASRHPAVDSSSVFTACSLDLREALSRVSASGAPYSIVESFTHTTQLVWLRQRLQRIRSPATESLTREMEDIFEGLLEDDFLMPLHLSSGSHSGGVYLDADGNANHSIAKIELDTEFHPGLSIGRVPGANHEITAPVTSEEDAMAVTSAASLGMYLDMIPLQRRDRFPLAARFLASFGVDQARLESVATRSSDLSQFVRETIKHRVIMSNDDIELMVTVEPFSKSVASSIAQAAAPVANVVHATRMPLVSARAEASAPLRAVERDVSDIPAAPSESFSPLLTESTPGALLGAPSDEPTGSRSQHGSDLSTSSDGASVFDLIASDAPDTRFMVNFHLKPHNPTCEVRMVNSYILRLEISSGTLVEDIGCLDPDDVLALLHERDAGNLAEAAERPEFAPYRENSANAADPSTAPPDDYISSISPQQSSVASSSSTVAVQGHSRTVSLAFSSESEGPAVMKGILYYKLGSCTQPMTSAPIKSIEFGHLLLDHL